MNTNRFFNAAKKDDTLTLSVYDVIGGGMFGEGITSKMVSDALKGDYKDITMHVNSPGGDAFEGVSIYNLLKTCGKPVNVIVDGLAASAASLVCMAGDTITMQLGTKMMIHEAQAFAMGDADQMRKMADTLETVTQGIADLYVARTGLEKDTVLAMMKAETWMDPEACKEKGFATALGDGSRVTNSFDLSKFKNAPEDLKAQEEVVPPVVVPPVVEEPVVDPTLELRLKKIAVQKRK